MPAAVNKIYSARLKKYYSKGWPTATEVLIVYKLLNFCLALDLNLYYNVSKKSWPNLYGNLLYKVGQVFLEIQYIPPKFIVTL